MKLSTPKFDRDAVERIRVEASFGLVVGLWPVHMVVFFLLFVSVSVFWGHHSELLQTRCL